MTQRCISGISEGYRRISSISSAAAIASIHVSYLAQYLKSQHRAKRIFALRAFAHIKCITSSAEFNLDILTHFLHDSLSSSCSFHGDGLLLTHSGLISAIHVSLHRSSWISSAFRWIFLMLVEVYYVEFGSHDFSGLIYVHLFFLWLNSLEVP